MELQPFNPRHARLLASWILDAQALHELSLGSERGAISPDRIVGWSEAADYPFMLLPEPEAPPVAYGELIFPRTMHGIFAQHVLVDPRERGKGYGWTCMERLGLAAHARFGYDRLGLSLLPGSEYALSMAQAMGFATVATRAEILDPQQPAVTIIDLSAALPFRPYAHRGLNIPETGDEPGYGRGLRFRPPPE